MKKYDGVLKRVREIEEKKGIKYLSAESKQYKILKVLCVLMAAWALCTNLLYILGNLLLFSGTDEFSQIKVKIITVGVATLAIVAGLILNRFKQYIASAVLAIIPSVFLILHFANELKDTLGFLGVKPSFYYRHFAPLLLMSIFIAIMTVIAVRAEIKTDRMYVKVTENLYNMYNIKADENSDITDEQWEEFLKNYNPYYTPQILSGEAENDG